MGKGPGAQHSGQSSTVQSRAGFVCLPRRPFISSLSCTPLVFWSCCVINNKIMTLDTNILATAQPDKLLLYVCHFLTSCCFETTSFSFWQLLHRTQKLTWISIDCEYCVCMYTGVCTPMFIYICEHVQSLYVYTNWNYGHMCQGIE